MSENRSIRVAYGKALAALGESESRLVVLDADVSSSTQSHFFAKAFPERFFNVGIAEPGMVDMGVGLALCGKIPVVNSFAFLLALRCAEQVRTHLGYGGANVKLAAGYGGRTPTLGRQLDGRRTPMGTRDLLPRGCACGRPAGGHGIFRVSRTRATSR